MPICACSKCKKPGDDGDALNAYDVELAKAMGADDIGITTMKLDAVADDMPEIRELLVTSAM